MNIVSFLGPKAENADELERLLLEVLHDHVFWRRNFHPSDPRLIAEADKRSDHFGETTSRMRDELFQILAELKRGAPLFSPRQVAHMVSDPTLPALVGYFAGLLYNQNNVVAEAAPATVEKERQFLSALARMVGYPPMLPERLPPEARRERTAFSWGHLASGGTAANIEALWIARNVRLFPLAVRLLASDDAGFGALGDIEVLTADGRERAVRELSTGELVNLPIAEVTELHLQIRQHVLEAGPARAADYEAALPSVRKAGLAGLMQRYNDRFPSQPLRRPIVISSRAAHYGWAKAVDVVGLGAAALRTLPVDRQLRLDIDELRAALRTAADDDEPVLMTIGILGTTEEGSVDPLHRIEELRAEAARGGLTFWHHVDAAFGGYLAAALPRDENGRALEYAAAGEDLFTRETYCAIAAAADSDSITIDPHKWGYVPYPAGAVLFRDYHVRDSIAYAAPYLPGTEATGFGGFLGRWTLEGSRPGAPAVSAYLSQAVVPLDPSGHGALVRDCVAGARALVGALRERFSAGPVRFALLAEPDTVGFCFALVPRDGVRSVAELNGLTRRLWSHVNVDGREDVGAYRYILSKTELRADAYREVLSELLPADVLEAAGSESVMLLRAFVVNPFVTEWNRRSPSFAEGLADFVARLVEDLLPARPVSTREDAAEPARSIAREGEGPRDNGGARAMHEAP